MLLVVLYHFWPNRLPGGYVGVDVFFVISGFLITSHLHREVARDGRVSLGAFYARRARRLLPAAGLVLLVTAAATLVWLPVTRWSTTAGELLASAFYVQNWVLAHRAVDYSALGKGASPVQHFWSLAVEEQFYLVWPGLILLLVVLSRRLRRAGRDRLLLGGILTVTALSLAWSVYATATQPAAAYFVTPTRIWELGVGAALALAAGRRQDAAPADRQRTTVAPGLLRWAGFAAIGASALALTAASPFPGYLALVPVLGTVAVIAAAGGSPRDPLWPLLRLQPVQFMGDVSYALYLWHWPAIVIAPFALGRTPVVTDKLLILAGCVGLAWLTKVAVETPTQRWRLLARPLPVAIGTAFVMLAVSGAAALLWQQVGAYEDAARSRLEAVQGGPCFGAAAVAAGPAQCGEAFAAADSLSPVPGDEPWFLDPSCTAVEVPLRVVTCRYGTDPPTARVALVGDSHAEHWRGALHQIAEGHNWELVEMFRGGCPVVPARILAINGSPVDTEGCVAWGQQVRDRLAEDKPDYIITSSWAGAFTYDTVDPEASLEAGADAFATTWRDWAAAGAQVIVLRDVPDTGSVSMPECLLAHPGRPDECARPRSEAVRPDAITVAAERVASERIRLIDMTDFFCDDRTCHAVVGEAPVYYDDNHITAQFSRSLSPFLLERIEGGPN